MSGCQRLAIRRRASCTSRTSNGASSSRSAIACSRSNTVAIELSTLANADPLSSASRWPANTSSRCTSSSKVYPPDREVLKDISLSFLPGREDRRARLQRLRQVLAAADHGRAATASSAATPRSPPGASVGLLEQEPALDETRTCASNVLDGVGHLRALLERFNELAANYSDETADEFARLQDEIDAADAWNLDGMIEHAMDALRCPPGDARGRHALGRRAPPRRALPAAAQPARPAAARRADQPPRRRVGRVARAPPRRVQGHRRRRHPRPLLPRQRRRLDPRARPRPRHPLPGQLLGLARAEAGAPRAERASQEIARQRTIAAELEWVRTNPKGRRNKSKARLANYEALLAQEAEVKLDQVQIHIPAGPRLGDLVIEATDLRKGFGDRLLIDGPLVLACRAAGSSA